MKIFAALCLCLVLAPSGCAFVAPSANIGKILTTNANNNKAAESALSAIDVAYVNDAMDMSSILNNDMLIPAAGAVAAALIGAAVGRNSDNGAGSKAAKEAEEELPKIDVSIPYDAAAKLAFGQLAKKSNANYAQFKELFETKAILEVKKKMYAQKVAREMEQMEVKIEEMQKEIDNML